MIDHSKSVTGSMPDWCNACEEAVKTQANFGIFRSWDICKLVVEGTPKYAGYEILHNSRKYKTFNHIKTFMRSDLIGQPGSLIQISKFGRKKISPTTLRYLNNLNNMTKLFKNFDKLKLIVEIGGGYGGESKIILDYFKLSELVAPKFVIHDLSTSYPLITKFLNEFGYSYIKGSSFVGKKDSNFLVISNGAFSEMSNNLQNLYLNNVIKKAKYGYFITNFESHSVPYGGFSTTDFIDKLKQVGKLDAKTISTEKFLTSFDKRAGTKLVVFGFDGELPVQKHRLRRYYFLEEFPKKISRTIFPETRVRQSK